MTTPSLQERAQTRQAIRSFAGASRPGQFCLRALLITLSSLLIAPQFVIAQQRQSPRVLSLAQAVKIALEENPVRKAALADTRAASANVAEARASLFPHATFSETATRGDDPVYVFGSRLRQQRFTSADLALNALNRPAPIGNFVTQVGGSWSLFDSFASWHGLVRAKQAKAAAADQLDRADQQIIFQVIDSYESVLLAQRQLNVAQQSLKTAQAILAQTQNRYESGIVVKSDLLSAEVRLAMRQQEVIAAQNNLRFAQARLSTSMGLPAEMHFHLAETLAEKPLPSIVLEKAEKQALASRPDLQQIRSEALAQHQSVLMAKSAFGPRINIFGDWEADNPTFLAGGGGNNWLAGIDLQVDVFSGGAKRAALAHQRAVESKIKALHSAAADAIRLEVRSAYYQMDAAQRQLAVARAAIAEAQESLRINQNRYDAGLSTISDLLAAEEAARRSQADYWDAVYRYQTSYANLELASGNLSPLSPVVTP